jgi:hypothetical protein
MGFHLHISTLPPVVPMLRAQNSIGQQNISSNDIINNVRKKSVLTHLASLFIKVEFATCIFLARFKIAPPWEAEFPVKRHEMI